MKRQTILIATLCLAWTTHAWAQTSKNHSYPSSNEINDRLRSLAAANEAKGFRLQTVGKTLKGRDILALEIGRTKAATGKALPANLKERASWQSGMLLVSGLEADSLVGSVVILELVERIATLPVAEFESLFAHRRLIAIPRVDHDGTERYFTENPAHGAKGNARLIDWDRDGRAANEDQPQDLNGDGFVSIMRQRHPEGTWIDDPDHPGRIRLADPKKGELGVYRVFPESTDVDHDGEFGEDGNFGVRLDQNFAHQFKEHDLGSGAHAMSEPASRALANFVLARPWLESVLVYGTHDNIQKLPKPGKTKASKSRFRRPHVTKYIDDDVKLLKSLSDFAKEKHAAAVSRIHQVEGSFEDWTYYQLGLVSAAINLFDVLDSKPQKETGESATRSTSSPTSKPAMTTQPQGEDDDSVEDAIRKAAQEGFIPWQKTSHGDLGEIEIGGWKPFVRYNPKAELIPILVQRQWQILGFLLRKRAQLEFETVSCRRLGEGLYEMETWIKNTGAFPSQTKQSLNCRSSRPDLLIFESKQEDLLQGKVLNNLGRIDANTERKHFRWLFLGNKGQVLHLQLAPSHCAPTTREITLP